MVIGKQSFRAEIGEKQGWVREKDGDKETRYPIAHVMGGKNVYYFLTQMPKGRLQVLPVAYDVHKQTWYDTTASGVRHFPDRRLRDEALPWTDRLFTFNTTCFDCHVSQLATNYDLATDTYHTTWREAGISCESCHGPGGQHTEAMEAGVKGHTSKDIKIIRTLEFGHAQMNDMCATCHAKLVPLLTEFIAGEKFYDHYDLITLEHHDFYPDGRDLGENYTFTSWSMSPCLKSDKLDCNQCHTPSGRPRFEGRQVQSVVPAVPRPDRREFHGPQPSQGRGHGQRVHRLPHADEPFRRNGADRSLDAFAHAGGDDRLQVAQRLQPVPRRDTSRPRRGLGRPVGPQVVSAGLPGRAAPPGGPVRCGAEGGLEAAAEMLADVQNKQADEIYRNSLVRLLRGCTDPAEVAGADRRLERRFAAGAGQRRRGPGRILYRREPLAARAPRPIPCGWCGSAPRRPWLPCVPEQIDDADARKCAPPGDGRVQEGHGGAARRLGLVFEPGQLRHGKRRLRRGG